jgi:hypothetical protein
LRDGMARNEPVIWVRREAEYFSNGGWTGFWWFARRVNWSQPKTVARHCEQSDSLQSALALAGVIACAQEYSAPLSTLGLVHYHRNSQSRTSS